MLVYGLPFEKRWRGWNASYRAGSMTSTALSSASLLQHGARPATMPKLIKRYAQSRLYDTQAARYVTISDLREWRTRGLAFTVVDAETNQDITTILLA
jgi:hypothetical protein